MIGYAILLFVLSALSGGAGDTYAELKAGDQVYQQVEVRQVTPQALIIRHRGGISQVLLRDLPVELRERYGYRAEDEEAWLAERRAREAQAAAARPSARPAPKAQAPATLSEALLARFGTPAEYHRELDMRPLFNELDLYVKRQGRRPSCSVFAVVSALEYQQARATREAVRLSEEYLVWATRKSLGIPTAADPNFDPERDGDLGFTLLEVVQALRVYGIPEDALMPNTFGKGMAAIDEPGPEVVEQARTRRLVTATLLTGRSGADRINNIVHVLNQGVPVVVGLEWPHNATLRRAPVLSMQQPVSRHAVTLVGYICDTGNPRDARFLFKNSWGPSWGINGHGWVTYDYMERHLGSAVFLDIVNAPGT